MLKKMVKMMLFVFVVCVFCNMSEHGVYAKKENEHSIQVDQEKLEESSLPIKWEPNSELKEFDEGGEIKRIRKYGSDGRATQDIDYRHGGSKHKFPHTHDWDWSGGDNNPSRRKDKPLPGAKKLSPKQKRKKCKKDKKSARDHKGKISEATKKTAVLGTVGTVVYFVISEGSRIVFPIRNLVPVL